MKERPIIFSAPMVRAILEGRKIQMRIPIEPQPNSVRFNRVVLNGYGGYTDEHGSPLFSTHEVGDRLWVRETFAWFEGDSPNDFETGDGWIYRASVPHEHDDGIRWRPSIHMPRAASRILLEITDVRVERLQEITRSGIRSEGLVCPDEFKSDDLEYNYRHWYPDAFKSLWDGIYSPGAYASNPWVWVRTFKKIQP